MIIKKPVTAEEAYALIIDGFNKIVTN